MISRARGNTRSAATTTVKLKERSCSEDTITDREKIVMRNRGMKKATLAVHGTRREKILDDTQYVKNYNDMQPINNLADPYYL